MDRNSAEWQAAANDIGQKLILIGQYLSNQEVKTTSEKVYVYLDSNLEITVNHQINSINAVLTMSGRKITVYHAKAHKTRMPSTFKPGRWLTRIEELARQAAIEYAIQREQKARKQAEKEELHYGAIKDGRAFPKTSKHPYEELA